MILFLLLAALIPQQVLIATSRGHVNVPVTKETGAAAVAAVLLAQPLGLTVSLEGSAARVTLGDRRFDFDVGSPYFRYDGAAYPLVGAPYVARDTLFLPLHWLAGHVPRLSANRYRWSPGLSRLDEQTVPAGTTTAIAAPPFAVATPPMAVPAAPNP